MKIILYLDDGIVTSEDKPTLERRANQIGYDLYNCGITVNGEKSTWYPTHSLEWMGITTDLEDFTYAAPVRKVSKISACLNFLTCCNSVSARALFQIIGFIISLQITIGTDCILMTRYMQIRVANSPTWDKKFRIDNEIKTELQFWHSFFNQGPISQKIKPILPSQFTTIFTDASDTGGGGFIDGMNNSKCFFAWSLNEIGKSSTYRELLAFLYALQSYESTIGFSNIIWRTDNLNAVGIISRGSMVEELQDIAIKIKRLCDVLKVRVFPEWVRRVNNTIADKISRIVDESSWTVNNDIFNYSDNAWGPYSYDRFADHLNNKCKNFNSKYNCPGSSGVNCFKFNWHGQNNWLVPPINLIGLTLSHMKDCRARGTLIIPRWESSYFWPLISDQNRQFKPFVKDWKEYVKPKYFFNSGNEKCIFKEFFKSNVLVLKIEFT